MIYNCFSFLYRATRRDITNTHCMRLLRRRGQARPYVNSSRQFIIVIIKLHMFYVVVKLGKYLIMKHAKMSHCATTFPKEKIALKEISFLPFPPPYKDVKLLLYDHI